MSLAFLAQWFVIRRRETSADSIGAARPVGRAGQLRARVAVREQQVGVQQHPVRLFHARP